jgi:hypothetical protein
MAADDCDGGKGGMSGGGLSPSDQNQESSKF